MMITVVGSCGRDWWTLALMPGATETSPQLCSIEHRTVFDYLHEAEDASSIIALSKMPVVDMDASVIIDFFQAPLAERQTKLALLGGSLDLSIERKAADIILGPQNWSFRVNLRFGITTTETRFAIDHTCVEVECD